MNKMLEWIRHNLPLVTGLVLCVLISAYAYGCESEGASILNPGTRVTRAELGIEVKQIAARYEIELEKADLSLAEIDKEDEFKRRVFEFGAATLETGQFNPVGLVGLLGWLIGGTSYLNGRKKDVIIARDRSVPV